MDKRRHSVALQKSHEHVLKVLPRRSSISNPSAARRPEQLNQTFNYACVDIVAIGSKINSSKTSDNDSHSQNRKVSLPNILPAIRPENECVREFDNSFLEKIDRSVSKKLRKNSLQFNAFNSSPTKHNCSTAAKFENNHNADFETGKLDQVAETSTSRSEYGVKLKHSLSSPEFSPHVLLNHKFKLPTGERRSVSAKLNGVSHSSPSPSSVDKVDVGYPSSKVKLPTKSPVNYEMSGSKMSEMADDENGVANCEDPLIREERPSDGIWPETKKKLRPRTARGSAKKKKCTERPEYPPLVMGGVHTKAVLANVSVICLKLF